MIEPLSAHFVSPINRQMQPESFEFPPMQHGLGLRVDQVNYGASRLRFRALVTCSLPRTRMESFLQLTRAIALFVEDADGGRSWATTFVDPFMRYVPIDEPNFDPARGAGASPDELCTAWAAADIEVELDEPHFSPSLFVTCQLQGDRSDTIAIDVKHATTTVLPNGSSHAASSPGT